MDKPSRPLQTGDYVLGTKFQDGEAWDPWCVGIYAGESRLGSSIRHHVKLDDGTQLRPNGFARCEVITPAQGGRLLANAIELERWGVKLWDLIHEVSDACA